MGYGQENLEVDDVITVWPLTKERQCGRFSRKAKMKERHKLLRPGIENQLLKDCVEYLENEQIPYIRLMEDWQWQWFIMNAPKQLRDAFSDLYGGWADLFIFKKMEGQNWNKVLPVELKSPGRKPRKGQAKRMKQINTSIVENFAEFISFVEDFQK